MVCFNHYQYERYLYATALNVGYLKLFGGL